MGRELLRQVQYSLRSNPKIKHELAISNENDNSNGSADYDSDDDDSILDAARAHTDWQPSLRFVIDAPFDTVRTPSEADVECIIFDYLSSHKTPHKARETLDEIFHSNLEYISTCL